MIWLIGNRGMLGSDVEKLLERRSLPFITSDIDVDITDPAALRAFAGQRHIEWIINCSAYTAVDAAEDERDKAFRINADGVLNIARLAEEKGAALVHVSTDYVFDGEKRGAYREDDATDPIGAYGASKLAGERQIASVMERYFIIRTAWLYGRTGKNFVLTMIRLFKERDEVRVVADQWGSPTYTGDLAAAMVKIVEDRSARYGIYHYTNEGKTTWHEFATEICVLARKHGLVDRDVRVVPITTAEYPTKARRPMNAYLSKEKIIRELGVQCRDWRAALADCIGNLRK
ncbi:MAG TPA: dTDP-4-dehydrorhamnose reductase [Spirochaetota bacterium]|nr:dTDP-4-dehydrorhamnose reductase [Spirochaetota bacterium]HPC41960.1 dTDP-4-dehydrorhamnose reductase [Spirochaetota bacterium]HPL19100.1 dTDP-4-dehydrorhamnose reductase [Spirochaetota bacterium]HQF06994.1 dTDP-4-dehydrorhamnose reductase [Spirochaetota bacterium]HQH95731.1 dTDP-4-dehydrorhamnose reductase [Spirochaetota bacterium]